MKNKYHRLKYLGLGVLLSFVLVFAFLLGVGGFQKAFAQSETTYTVITTNDSGPGSLRQAIIQANLNPGGDTIIFDMPGCTSTIPCVFSLLNPLPVITDSLTISGTEASGLIIDANHNFRGLNMGDVSVTISDLTIRNGNTDGRGGGIRSFGSLTLQRVHLFNNYAEEEGGGVYAGSDLIVHEGYFFQNASEFLGGGLFAEAELVLSDTQFISNTAYTGGGAYGNVDVWINGGEFIQNQSNFDGAGLYASNSLTLTNTSFLSNTTTFGRGGGLLASNSAQILDAWFENNFSNIGGGLYVESDLSLENTTFLRNVSENDNGGGAYVDGNAWVKGGHFEENTTTGGYGGGLFAGGSFSFNVITGTVFLNNTGGLEDSGGGGGGFFTYGNASISDSWFEGNQADQEGGGVSVHGDLNLENSTFLDNSAGTYGGGAFSEGLAHIQDAWFENNLAEQGGGLSGDSSVVLTQTTFMNNAAMYGGGLLAYENATITGGFFEQNTSSFEGGGAYVAETLNGTGTEFVNNSAGTLGGGAIAHDAILSDTTFLHNTADTAGGGLRADVVQVSGSTFAGNASQYGGGIYSFDILELANVSFSQNSAIEYGGGIFGVGNITIISSHFYQNVSEFNGGGLAGIPDVEGLGSTEIVNSLFAENSAPGAGGAVVLSSPFGALAYTMTINASTFLGNASDVGGAVYYTLGDGDIVNSLFARNTATTDGSSLGLYTFGTVSLIHTTMVSDWQNTVSGIRFHNGVLYVHNTIFAQHTMGILNVNGTLNQDYNLFFQNDTDIDGDYTGGTHSFEGDPQFLFPDQDDFHLGIGSEALDAGTDAGVSIDVDGNPRPFGTGFDIGFDEANPITGLAISYSPNPTVTVQTPAVFTATVADGDGILYSWDFGDGTPTMTGNPLPHTFTAIGTYVVSVTATNSWGSVTVSTEILVVEAVIPPATYRYYLPLVIR